MSTPARILMVTGDTEPSAPAAGQILLYAKTDGVFYSKNSSNVENPLAGTVASVNASGGTTGMAFTGGPITGSGTLTLSGVLGVANGGTGSTSQAGAAAAILPSQTGNAGRFLTTDGTTVSWATVTGTGTVTSVTVNGSAGRITSTGSPITSSGSITMDLATSGVTANTYGSATQVPVFTVDQYGRITSVTNTTISAGSGTVTSVSTTGGTTGLTLTTTNPSTTPNITLAGTLGIANGGTGATTANAALNAFLPSQTGNAGRFLTTDGTNSSWAVVSGTGTVTSVSSSGGTTGLTLTTTNPTTTPSLTLAGTLAIANGGTGATAAPAARTNLGATTIGSNIFTATNPGAITFLRANADNTVSFLDAATFRTAIGAGAGTVTSVSVTTANGVSGSVLNPTTAPAITLTLGAITPTSVAATGTVTGSNLSGTNTGDQTITLTGDVTGSGTGSFAATLSNTGVSAGTYGSATQVPVFTVDAKGRISGVTNTTITGGGSSTPEIVIFRYSSGGSGNFTAVDAIYSQTSGVTTTITDGTNCIATYAFTGKSNPPKSITTYGQVRGNPVDTTDFVIKDTTSLPSAKIFGGGTPTTPDIISSFTSSNLVTLQTRMSDTGATAALGQRAWLMVIFGF